MAPKLLESGDCTPEDLCFSLQVTRIFSNIIEWGCVWCEELNYDEGGVIKAVDQGG